MNDEVMFGMQINIEVFCTLMVSIWVCVARHFPSTQNNKFTKSLRYLKENVNDEFNFLSAYNRQRFLQIDTVSLGFCYHACQNYPK